MGFGKIFNNKTDKDVALTLYIREGDDPGDSAGTKDVNLPPFETQVVNDYNKQETYLNGLVITALFNGEVMSRQEFVVTRGSELDNKLNQNDTIDIVYENGYFDIHAYNSYYG